MSGAGGEALVTKESLSVLREKEEGEEEGEEEEEGGGGRGGRCRITARGEHR